MLTLLLALTAHAAAPLLVVDDPAGPWLQLPLPLAEIERIAALPGAGPWAGDGPYARTVSIDRVGDVVPGATVSTTTGTCEVTGFWLLDRTIDDGARKGHEGDPTACSAPAIAARLRCDEKPGPVALVGTRAPRAFTESPASDAERAAALTALAPDLDRLAAPHPEASRDVQITRWSLDDRAVLLVRAEAWTGERDWGCGREAFYVMGWAVLDAATRRPVIPFTAGAPGPVLDGVFDSGRDGGVDVLVRDLDGDVLIGPGGLQITRADQRVCVCLC